MICDVSRNEDRQCYMLYTESNILGLKCRYYTASLKAFFVPTHMLPIWSYKKRQVAETHSGL